MSVGSIKQLRRVRHPSQTLTSFVDLLAPRRERGGISREGEGRCDPALCLLELRLSKGGDSPVPRLRQEPLELVGAKWRVLCFTSCRSEYSAVSGLPMVVQGEDSSSREAMRSESTLTAVSAEPCAWLSVSSRTASDAKSYSRSVADRSQSSVSAEASVGRFERKRSAQRSIMSSGDLEAECCERECVALSISSSSMHTYARSRRIRSRSDARSICRPRGERGVRRWESGARGEP